MIKMRINEDNKSKCEECKISWDYTGCMYDLMLVDTKFTLCRECADTLFGKLLKASCMFNGKVKNKEDMARINRENTRKNKRDI